MTDRDWDVTITVAVKAPDEEEAEENALHALRMGADYRIDFDERT